MIRFILKRKISDGPSGFNSEELETVLLDVPEIESRLLSGGRSDYGYDQTILVGVSIEPDNKPTN